MISRGLIRMPAIAADNWAMLAAWAPTQSDELASRAW